MEGKKSGREEIYENPGRKKITCKKLYGTQAMLAWFVKTQHPVEM